MRCSETQHGMHRAATTSPASRTAPSSRRRRSLLRWVFPEGLPALDLAAPVIDLGRGPDNHVVLSSASASRNHARIERRGRARAITDRGSRNGVFVDGTPITTAPLQTGSVVRIGDWVGVVCEPHGDLDEPRELCPGLLGSERLEQTLNVALKAAPSAISLLIFGETGTGKELLARAVHQASGRTGPFVALNCAALSEALLDAELFGHERGAFTGADRERLGFIRAAHRGTLLLDEVGELSLAAQAKLLRVLEERAVTPVGSWAPLSVDMRVIGATHRDLARSVADGSFRADLFARLEGVVVQLPPLRERREDIAHLFRELVASALGRRGPQLTARFVERLCLHEWPRNVRELRRVAERLAVLQGHLDSWRDHHLVGTLGHEDRISPVPTDRPPATPPRAGAPSREQLSAALDASGGNVASAARTLSVSKQTLYRWLNDAGLSLDSFRGARRSAS